MSDTPRTDNEEWPAPKYAQEIVFEGCRCVVMAPEEYEALYEHARTLERELAAVTRELDEARAEVERLRLLGQKVNAVRNSIIGAQSLNWSEHVYPLVAALDAAGFRGQAYPEARKNVGTLIERATRAEAEVERLRKAMRNIVDLSAGYDEGGSLGPKPPWSWETVARMAMDFARAAIDAARKKE